MKTHSVSIRNINRLMFTEVIDVYCKVHEEHASRGSAVGIATRYGLDGSRDSAVGIATRYGLDGPGIEFRWRRDFPHLSRPALRTTQPPIQWVPGLSRG